MKAVTFLITIVMSFQTSSRAFTKEGLWQRLQSAIFLAAYEPTLAAAAVLLARLKSGQTGNVFSFNKKQF